MLDGRKPKFLLSLAIKDLTNIPNPNGVCYVKWVIKDNLTSSQLKGKTDKVHIKDYKVHWNYRTEQVLKIGIHSRSHELQSKVLILYVIVVPHHHHHHHQHDLKTLEHLNPDCSNKTVLGFVEINLSEYINHDEKNVDRFLLKDSKINAILNLHIGMELIKGSSLNFKVPQKTKANGKLASLFSDDHSTSSHRNNNNSSIISSTEELYKSLAISNDPVVNRLYEKTFEISWDLRPGEFNLLESVDDIFNGGDGWAKNEEGTRLIDLQTERVKHRDKQKRILPTDLSSSNYTEWDIRGEMKSWYTTQQS